MLEANANAASPATGLVTVIEQCADRAMARVISNAPASEAALYFVALPGHELCNQNIDAGRSLLDLVDVTKLQPATQESSLPDEILITVGLANNRRAEIGDEFVVHHFIGGMQAVLNRAGRPDVAEAIDRMANPQRVPS